MTSSLTTVPSRRSRRAHAFGVREELERIVAWYARNAYGRWEGAAQLPFYCDATRVGHFAVDPTALKVGDDDALFRLLVVLTMYQARRDVDIMQLQRAMPKREATAMVSTKRLSTLVDQSRCVHLQSAEAFEASCSVRRDFARDRAICDRAGTSCHVKNATMAIRRMGDMGMLATAAWLRLRDDGGGFGAQLDRMCRGIPDPAQRANAMVLYVSGFYRIGIKLATMFVSALATPVLAPGLTPWWPFLDGNHLVVVDANVARVIDVLHPTGAKTFEARARWLRGLATTIDLDRFHEAWPKKSPRLLQQAIYVFRSKSNRLRSGDCCETDPCLSRTCPFHAP